MATATVSFHKCIQDSQDYGGDDEHMISRVFFSLHVSGKTYPDLHVEIKQTVGSNFQTGAIEVGRPVGYKGPLDYEAFRDGVEQYYRGLVGYQASAIQISGGTNIRMQHNLFSKPQTIQFDVEEGAAGW